MRLNSFSGRLGLIAAMIVMSAVTAMACDIRYRIEGPGISQTVTPGRVVDLQAGSRYVVTVTLREDHGSCRVPPQDTVFLLDESRWRVLRESQPLVLQHDIEWQSSGRSHTAEVVFVAAADGGSAQLEIIRSCPTHSGYHEYLLFNIA